ncbi:hypothetical protein EV183_001402 [Coemansia sp. RSA 2336]|nr:hypothetical protein EV183_001402 [Coemansia sp. RSA 2336]
MNVDPTNFELYVKAHAEVWPLLEHFYNETTTKHHPLHRKLRLSAYWNQQQADARLARNLRSKFGKDPLSAEEMDYLMNGSQQKLLDFYRIWTAKEAYVKAIGTGIAEFDIRSISVHLLEPAGNPKVCIEGKESEFYFKSGTLDAEDYVYCIATSSEPKCAFSTTDLLDFTESSHRTAA